MRRGSLARSAHLDQAATKELDRVGIDRRLRELIRIRASQLNGCAYCIDMHTKDARAVGETEQRLYALPAWARDAVLHRAGSGPRWPSPRRSPCSPPTTCPAAAYAAVAAEFSPGEVAALLSLIVTINAWNAIGVTARCWLPGSYEP